MIIRQAAFAKGQAFLKGALHVHTTRSDGRLSPEEVIRYHRDNGYDFMALTDHNVLNHINHADVPMTMLAGVERDFLLPGAAQNKPHCVHVVGLGVPGHPDTPAQDVRPAHPGRGEECLDAQPMIDEMHRWGLRTFYAHPEWSGTTYQDFGCLTGNFAMEIWNSGCVIENDQDTNAAYWDEALDDGKVVYGVAVDDGHAPNHHCKGWVMVSSANCASDILEALEKGEFYASCGPEIHDFYVEDGVAHVLCSEAVSVRFISLRHPLPCVRDTAAQLTHAQCRIPDTLQYVRACVTDAQGRRAWTNPIFLR